MALRRPRTGSRARARPDGSLDDPVACVMGDIDLLRPLGLAGIRCAAVAHPDGPTRFSRFTCAWVPRFDAWDEQASQVEELLRFGRAQPARPVLYYGGDPELLIVSRFRDELSEAFDFVVPEERLVDDLVDKSRFRELSARLDLPVPESRHLRPGQDPAPDGLPFPLMVKPITRHQDIWAPIAGGSKALQVDDADGFRALWRKLADARMEILVQEIVPGPETRIESYHAYIDRAGEVAGEFTGRKIRTLPPDYGHSTALMTTDAEDVARLGRDVVKRVDLRGLVKVDVKRAPDGTLRLLEINPRYTLWHHLGAVAGVNLPALVYADLTGRPRPPVAKARPGLTWSEPWHDLQAARACGMGIVPWVTWTLRCPAVSNLAWDDPMPLLRGRLLGRVRSRLAVRST